MKTRSQTKPLYNFDIDFDEASRAWMLNKRRVGESYEYIEPVVEFRQDRHVRRSGRLALKTAPKYT